MILSQLKIIDFMIIPKTQLTDQVKMIQQIYIIEQNMKIEKLEIEVKTLKND